MLSKPPQLLVSTCTVAAGALLVLSAPSPQSPDTTAACFRYCLSEVCRRLHQTWHWVSQNHCHPPCRPSSAYDAPYWTTNTGMPIWNNNQSLTVGARGPVLLEDFHLVEKLAQFDRERIPERVVHARGASAKGFFEVRSRPECCCPRDLWPPVGVSDWLRACAPA